MSRDVDVRARTLPPRQRRVRLNINTATRERPDDGVMDAREFLITDTDNFPYSSELATDPAVRLRMIKRYFGQKPAEEYICFTLGRLALRMTPDDAIAKLFNVHVNTVVNWRKKLQDRWADEFKKLKTDYYFSDCLKYFDYQQANLSQIAFSSNATNAERIRASVAASNIKSQQIDFLKNIGVFSAYRYESKSEEDKSKREANKIKELVDIFMAEDDEFESKVSTTSDTEDDTDSIYSADVSGTDV